MEQKITEREMLQRFQAGAILLPPLIVRSNQVEEDRSRSQIDALLEVALPGEDELFRFVVESKSRSTPEAVQAAAVKAMAAVRGDEWPMVQVPYLAPDRLEYLERLRVSGVDLCGNGVVLIPNRLCVVRSGQPNAYRDSRPLNNPYRGRSALVARKLLTEPTWPGLGKLVRSIEESGAELSLGQASKAIRALQEDLVVVKVGGAIKLQDPVRLLDKLGTEWRRPSIRKRKAFRFNEDPANWARRFSSHAGLRWALTGESSASRYVAISQGGPRRIAVSDLSCATRLLGKPVAGARIMLSWGSGEMMNVAIDDRDGHYLADALGPGTFMLNVIPAVGRAMLSTSVTLESGKTLVKDIRVNAK